MSAVTVNCQRCGQPHALYWECNLAGRNLKYICSHYPRIKILKDGARECHNTITAVTLFNVEPYLGLDIPEKWSKRLTRQVQRERECELRLNLETPRIKKTSAGRRS